MTNPAVADNAAIDQVVNRSTRRALLGLGVGGAALAISRSVSAAPSGADVAAFAISAELAASDLYAAAEGDLWEVLSESHRAFAERIAGLSGVSANRRNEELYDSLVDSFSSGDPSATALGLENVLAATHTDLLGLIDDAAALGVIASIIASESRQAAVIATESGASLDVVLVNTAEPLSPEA